MDFLGTVYGTTSEGHIIVRCGEAPAIGTAVFDDDRKRVGVVKRVFGPVDGPYASVRAQGEVRRIAEGRKLYFNRRNKSDGKTKRRN